MLESSMTEMDVTQVLEALARRQPAAPALQGHGRTTLRYADLSAQIRYVRERLGQWDIRRGDFVVGVIPLRLEMAVACATLPATATFAQLSPALTADVYCELFGRLRPKALVLPMGFDHPARIVARRYKVAEIELVADSCAPAGMFTLDLGQRQESLIKAGSANTDWAYLLTTSGTTGRAKLVPRSHRLTATQAEHLGDWLQLTPNDIGCHLVPMHHVQGLTTALMIPLLRGACVICLPESDIDSFFAKFAESQLTWFTAPVTHQREILRRAPEFRDAIARNTLRCMRVSSGRLATDEIDRIEQTFGAPLLMGFGMTEATPITHDPLPPRVRKRGSVGMPVCDHVAIMSDDGTIATAGAAGEVIVRSPLVFDGYFDDDEATASAFVDGWLRTGDLGRFDDDGYLCLVGRMKDIINRGGEKISPVEVDAAIEAVPGVRAAATFAIPHRGLGEEIAAAVVTDPDVTVTESDILDRVRQRVGAKRVPRRIYFVDQLPRTDLGKVRRSELPRLLGLDGPKSGVSEQPAREASSPRSALEAALTGLWFSVLEVGSIGVNDDFFLLGGDSLQGGRLLANVKAVFGVELTMRALFGEAATVAGMARAIESIRNAKTAAVEGPQGFC
jgi:acyl-CoA synthetase (AMP-forming)/AMP-acid ligase II